MVKTTSDAYGERKFSAASRPDWIERLANTSYDVLVIGGGITGAAAAFLQVTGLMWVNTIMNHQVMHKQRKRR